MSNLFLCLSGLAIISACTEVDHPDESMVPPTTTVVASERSTGELGVASWEISADGAATRIIGRDAASARQVEMVVRRDDAAPDERVQLEAVFPDRGELQLTREGMVEGASSDYLQRLGADVQADLGHGAISAAAGGGRGSTTSASTVSFSGSYHFAWNLFNQSAIITVGGPCPPGTTRVPSLAGGEISADWGSFGIFMGFLYSPATDCTGRFYMGVSNGHWDDFHWAILTNP